MIYDLLTNARYCKYTKMKQKRFPETPHPNNFTSGQQNTQNY